MTATTDVLSAFEKMKAPERIQWLNQEYGSRLVLSSSFGIQAAVMLDLVSKHAPEIPIVWIDTGYLFPETYQYVEELKQTLHLNLKEYQPLITAARQEALHGKLWEQGEEGNAQYGLIIWGSPSPGDKVSPPGLGRKFVFFRGFSTKIG